MDFLHNNNGCLFQARSCHQFFLSELVNKKEAAHGAGEDVVWLNAGNQGRDMIQMPSYCVFLPPDISQVAPCIAAAGKNSN